MKKTYLVIWTYISGFGGPYRTETDGVVTAIFNTVGCLYLKEKQVRYLVFEVGGDLVHNGTMLEAVKNHGFTDTPDSEFIRREMLREGYTEEELPDQRGNPYDDYDPVCLECGEELCPDCGGFFLAETGVICTRCVNATV